MPKSVSSAPAPAGGVLHQEISFPDPRPAIAGADTEKISFWQQLFLVPDDQWWSGVPGEKGYRVYLYDRVQGGSYLEVITHPFDVQWIKERRGGGAYRVQLNDSSGKIVESASFAIEGDPRAKAPAAAPTVPLPDTFQTQVLRMIQDGQERQEKLIERILDRESRGGNTVPSQLNPMALIEPVLGGIVGIFSSLMAKNQGPSMTEMLTLMDRNKPPDIMEVMIKAKAAGIFPDQAAGGTLMDQVTGMMAVADKLGWGNSHGGKSLTESLIEKGPEILKVFGDGVSKFTQLEESRLKTAQVLAAMRNSPPPAPPPQIAAAPIAAPIPIPQPAPPSAPLDDVQPVEAAANLAEMHIQQVKIDMVQGIAGGCSGADIFSYLKVKAPLFLNGMCRFDAQQKVIGVVSVEELEIFCASDEILKQVAGYKDILSELLDEVKAATVGD